MKKKLLFLYMAIILFSCKKDDIVVDLGYNYFPESVGTYVIYDVDSFVYNNFTHTVDTFTFQVKEIIESVYKDNANRNTLRLERYYRGDASQDWLLQDVWVANKTVNRAEKVEENQRFVKLIFPTKKGLVWNGNASNTNGEQNYIYTDVDVKRTINNLSFDSTLLVTQIADSNLIEKKVSVEMYAKNVGMIYKHFASVKDNDAVIDFGKTFNERIDSGFDYYYRVNSFGK